MVSALYIVLGALFIIKFSWDVVRLRRQYHVAWGDGGFWELQNAVRVQGNAVEYLPLGGLLLVMMEINGGDVWMVHVGGLLLLAGRVMHYLGMHQREIRWRRYGMIATFVALLFAILMNLVFMPWDLMLSL
ncbi:MAPEG family protein [Pantoea sp. 1.19]|uniref:MAPEG family protein n=1 Tax=Pantoea sp. 1.19 TaxID=1925589 RepID=UPI0009489FAC|nr:MAPEG family protein [Pantoea sp. 1.19]